MVKTTVVKQVEDEKNIYYIGNCVRVLMQPRNKDRPKLASEFIGKIIDVTPTTFILDCIIDNTEIDVFKVDRIRFAKQTETFDNTPNF